MVKCIECQQELSIFKILMLFISNRAKCSGCGTLLFLDVMEMKLYIVLLVSFGMFFGLSFVQSKEPSLLILLGLVVISAFVYLMFKAKLKVLKNKKT